MRLFIVSSVQWEYEPAMTVWVAMSTPHRSCPLPHVEGLGSSHPVQSLLLSRLFAGAHNASGKPHPGPGNHRKPHMHSRTSAKPQAGGHQKSRHCDGSAALWFQLRNSGGGTSPATLWPCLNTRRFLNAISTSTAGGSFSSVQCRYRLVC